MSQHWGNHGLRNNGLMKDSFEEKSGNGRCCIRPSQYCRPRKTLFETWKWAAIWGGGGERSGGIGGGATVFLKERCSPEVHCTCRGACQGTVPSSYWGPVGKVGQKRWEQFQTGIHWWEERQVRVVPEKCSQSCSGKINKFGCIGEREYCGSHDQVMGQWWGTLGLSMLNYDIIMVLPRSI